MARFLKGISLAVCLSLAPIPFYTQTKTDYKKDPATIASERYSDPAKNPTRAPDSEKKLKEIFLNFINDKSPAPGSSRTKKEDKKILREEWRKMLGADIFFPYFKAKEVENWASEKASLKIHKIKAKPKFRKNRIEYTFRIKF